MFKKLDTGREAAPLYIQIKNDLQNKIEQEHWKIGDKITSELELCDYYDVSRITVREAINELVWKGYLVRKRAKGTFVLDYKKTQANKNYFTHVKSFTYEINEIGKEAKTFQVSIKIIKADDFLSSELNIPKNSDVIELKRVRGVDNKYLVFFKTYWKYEPHFSLEDNDYYGSLYEKLNDQGIKIEKVKEYLEAIHPNKEMQNALKIEKNTPVLKRARRATNANESFIEYTECYYIGDNYRYYIDLDLNV